MTFQVSPGVNITEIDQTTSAPAVATTEGAIAGVFKWGPMDQRVLVDSEGTLVGTFGRPTTFNSETFFTAASFLAYGNKLFVVRAGNTAFNAVNPAKSATANSLAVYANYSNGTSNSELYPSFIGGNTELQTSYVIQQASVKNASLYDDAFVNLSSNPGVHFSARFPGDIGNSLKISVCPSAEAFSSTVDIEEEIGDAWPAGNTYAEFETLNVQFSIGVGTQQGVISVDEVLDSADFNVFDGVINAFTIGDIIIAGDVSTGTTQLKLRSFGDVQANATHTFVPVNFENRYQQRGTFVATELQRNWEYFNVVDKAPAPTITMIKLDRRDSNNDVIVDGMHIVVSDENGAATGVPGTILEVYNNISRATDAKTEDGATNFYKHVLRDTSRWVWAFNDVSGVPTTTASQITTLTTPNPITFGFEGGADGESEADIAEGTIMAGYDYFRNAEEIDVSLILAGKARGGVAGELIANYISNNIVDNRRDCLLFVSPSRTTVVNAGAATLANIVAFRNALTNSSYAVMDSGYKYMYDRYNDVYRWVPLNGDIAGLTVRTDETRDPWFSPAGLQRGNIKNIVKLAFNPTKGDRDQLYKSDINPVVTIPGQGTVLFGDKTLLGRPSPFDRINVRRLFIVLEKTVATAAKFTLFEFNDEFTRAQFKNLVEPFLRDVQGRRGIFDFRVVCDETNNTENVIDSNQFVGDIYVKPAKTINFIQLNFVAVRSGVEFSEIVGAE